MSPKTSDDLKPAKGIVVGTILGAAITSVLVVGMFTIAAFWRPIMDKFPPRDQFKKSYQTVKYKDTVCFKCHKTGIRLIVD